MKKLVGLFLWTCAATILAQACILALSYFRGNIDKHTMTKVIALLNGIDIQGELLRKQLVSTNDVPVPSLEEISEKRAMASLELASRESALIRMKEAIDSKLADLDNKVNRFEARRLEFFNELEKMRKGTLDEGLSEVGRMLEVMAPDQAKSMILTMKKKGSMRDVVTILKAMPDEKRKKISAEFTKEEESELSDILAELRKGDPAASLINQALDGQSSGAP